jgi:internalin A
MEYTLTPTNINEPIPIETTILVCERLRYLPESIRSLINLQELHCNWCKLQELPKWIGNLSNLQMLFCENNQLQQLPESIGNLVDLQILYCGYNQLKQLPESMGSLINLQQIKCGFNQLQELPESIGNLINLQVLCCENNKIRELLKTPVASVAGHTLKESPVIPSETCESIAIAMPRDTRNGCFGNLINLQILHCQNNQLQQLPESIGNLINLRKIICFNNQLREFPESIGNLINLKYLHCSLNPFNDNFKNIISKCSIINAQEMLQALRDAYLIPTDNSYILK